MKTKLISRFSLILFLLLSASTHLYADATSDSNQVFDWAEETYPEYFSPAGANTESLSGYLVRYYSATETYLGSRDGDVYVYGAPFGPTLLSVGTVEQFLVEATPPALDQLVDTGQTACYSATVEITCPQTGSDYFGQDGQYQGNTPSYTDNGNGTTTDNHTGLTWSQSVGDKVTLTKGLTTAATLTLAGHNDWRVPTIKELYTLIDFTGYTGTASSNSTSIPANAIPFIDTESFDFEYGDTSSGERYIDAQWLSSTTYVSTTMAGDNTVFGVNFADGRIKGYGYSNDSRPNQTEKKFYIRYVRGDNFGDNQFTHSGDDTIADSSSNLSWTRLDSGGYNTGPNQDGAMDWPTALAWCENLTVAGLSDWRLPNTKELQTIVDYTRSPATSGTAAIDPIFQTTSFIDEKNQINFPYFWTSTTHLDGPSPGNFAAYISFGEALGVMDLGDGETVYDVHGAGAQRSDPKTGNPDDVTVNAPQGDIWRINNYARCVRNSD